MPEISTEKLREVVKHQLGCICHNAPPCTVSYCAHNLAPLLIACREERDVTERVFATARDDAGRVIGQLNEQRARAESAEAERDQYRDALGMLHGQSKDELLLASIVDKTRAEAERDALRERVGELERELEITTESRERAIAKWHDAKAKTDARKTVVLSGSSRFIDVMAVAAWEEEKRGLVALSCHLLPRWYMTEDHHGAEAQGVAEEMDVLHLDKVRRADEMLVIDVHGYIGDSTWAEIAFAEERGIPVRRLSEEMPEWYRAALKAKD